MNRPQDAHPDSSASIYLRLQARFGVDSNPRISLAESAAPWAGGSDCSTRYAAVAELEADEATTTLQVWDTDLRRPLAMKVLRDTAGGAEARLSRFLAEAQISAQLDHPGIAPVHELGLDRDGNAFFTMSLVRGETFATVVERVRRRDDPDWTLAKAVGVLQRACEAMAFAHDRGVVHRKLAPSAIRVGRFGEVFVGDWSGSVAATSEDAAVDPEPDIAAFGRLLAQLLDRLPSRPPAELVAIRDKALATSAERYPDFASMVSDLRAYRERRVVRAHATGAAAELRTWVRRNRPLAFTSAAAALLLLVGLFASVTLAARERRASELAAATAQLAFGAVDELLSRIGESRLRNVPQMDGVRRELLDDALAMLEQLDRTVGGSDRRPDIAAALHRIGSVQVACGEHRAALATFEREVAELESFLAEFPDHPLASNLLLTAKDSIASRLFALGEEAAALDMQRAAIQWADELERRVDLPAGFQERKLRVLGALVGSLQQAGETAEAAALLERVVANRRARLERAGDATRRDEQRRLAESIADLGWIHAKSGDLDRAGEHYRDALARLDELIEAHPEFAHYRYRAAHHTNNYAAALMDAQRFDDVFGLFSDALEKAEVLVEDFPDRLDYRIVLASAANNLGAAYRRTGRPAQAIPLMQRGYAAERAALAIAPDDAFLRRNILSGGLSLCDTLLRVDRWRDAADHMAELRELPFGDQRARFAESHLMSRCAGFAAGAGEEVLAEDYARRALSALEEAVDLGFAAPQVLTHEGFDAIRDRAEFARLAARMREAASKGEK